MKMTVQMIAEQIDPVEEAEIDRLRIAAFMTNSEADRTEYFNAASRWFQARHYRRIAGQRTADRLIIDKPVQP